MTDSDRDDGVADRVRHRAPSSKRHPILRLVAGVVGTLLLGAAPNPHMTWLQWVALTLGAVLVIGAAADTAKEGDARRRTATAAGGSRVRKILRTLRDHLRTLVTLALITFFVLVAGPPLGSFARNLSYGLVGCPPAAQLRMVAGPETITTARELAAAYERRTAEDNYGCAPIRVYVFPATPQALAERVRAPEAWSDDSQALTEIGPRPDVWLAGTSHEVSVLHTDVSKTIPVDPPIAVARSPLVLAVPAPADRRDATWSALFREYVDHGGVVRPAPTSSALGLLGAALLYGSERATQYPPLPVSAVERRLATARDAVHLPLGDTTELLCRLRSAPSDAPPPPAVVTSEQEVARYNAGLPLGGSCTDTTRPGPDRQLLAQYPTDTADQDVSLVPFTWSDPAQRRAAVEFCAWLTGDAGRAALADAGLRPPGPALDVPLTLGSGVELLRPPSSPPTDAVLTAAAASYATTQQPSRLLFVFDTSGSMKTPVAGGTRGQVAAAAMKAALHRLGPNDEFGLWLFPGGTGTANTGPVKVERNTPEHVTQAESVLDALPLDGPTPLFRAVVQGVATLAPADPAARDPFGVRAVVVLTDGENTVPGLSVDDVVRAVTDRGVRVVVVALGEIRCAGGGLPAIIATSGGACIDPDTSAGDEGVLTIVDRLKGAG